MISSDNKFMAKKKKAENMFKPTGKMVMLIEVEDTSGPVELRINDTDIVLDIMRIVVGHMGTTLDVSSYSKAEEEVLAKYVRGE